MRVVLVKIGVRFKWICKGAMLFLINITEFSSVAKCDKDRVF